MVSDAQGRRLRDNSWYDPSVCKALERLGTSHRECKSVVTAGGVDMEARRDHRGKPLVDTEALGEALSKTQLVLEMETLEDGVCFSL